MRGPDSKRGVGGVYPEGFAHTAAQSGGPGGVAKPPDPARIALQSNERRLPNALDSRESTLIDNTRSLPMIIFEPPQAMRPPWEELALRVPGHEDCSRCGGYGTTTAGAPCPTGVWTDIRTFFSDITIRDLRSGVLVVAVLIVAFLIVGSLT